VSDYKEEMFIILVNYWDHAHSGYFPLWKKLGKEDKIMIALVNY
jgi:hypothetical protein